MTVQQRIHRVRHPYAASNYDDDLCLKPPLLLWLATLYLSRAIILALAAGVGSFAGINKDSMNLLHGVGNSYAVLPSLVAIPVLFALTRRVPAASNLVRWIWVRGRVLLAVSAVTDLVLSSISIALHGGIDDQTLLSSFAAVVDLYFILYLLCARRIRDTFADFPPRPEPKQR